MKKVGILGGGSCFAQNIASHLISRGYDCFGIGRSAKKSPAFWLVPESYRYFTYSVGPDNEFIMDLLDIERPQYLICLAAQGEGAASFRPVKNWKYFYQTNATALVELTEHLSSRNYLSRFVQIGTSELYGSVTAPSKETDAIVPTSPYAASKAAFDLHLMAISKVLDFPMNIIRPSNCYVPGQQLHRVIPKALLCGVAGKKLPLQGGGKAEKSYLHGTDLARAIELVIEKAPLGEVYNCGPDQPTSIKEVVQRCADALDMRFEDLCEIAPDRDGQDSRYWLDSTKLKGLGWEQTVDWDTGLRGMVDWVDAFPELGDMPTEFRMRA